MNAPSLTKEATAIFISILFLVLGFVAVWIMKALVGVSGDVLFVALLFVPIIVYTIFSGRLQEFSAGGFQAKFADLAKKPIEATAETIEGSIQNMEVLAKAGLTELEMAMRHIDESQPITLTLVMGTPHYYSPSLLRDYLRTLSQYRTFKFIVILDREKRFVAYLPTRTARQILELPELGHQFVEAINNDRVQELQRYPGVVTKTISTKTTNMQALKEMTDRDLDALVVIDENKQLRGVIEREKVISQLMLALTVS